MRKQQHLNRNEQQQQGSKERTALDKKSVATGEQESRSFKELQRTSTH